MTVKKTLIISIACGLIAFVFSGVFIHLKEREIAGGGELVNVVVAARDIGQNTYIERGLVRFRRVPRAFVQPSCLRDMEEVLGRVSIAAIKNGEQILGSHVVSASARTGLSSKVPNGKRAVSIFVKNEDGAGGLITADDYVDVIATFDYGESDRSDKYTFTLFQNVPVLAVDSETRSARNPEGVVVVEKKNEGFLRPSGRISGPENRGSILTLALEPWDASKLVFAHEAGGLTLLLRSPRDRGVSDDERAVKIEDVTTKTGFTRKNFKEYRGGR